MKSFVAVALCLSLIETFAFARIPHSYRQLQERDDESQSPNGILNWFSRLLKRQQDQQNICYQDDFYNFVYNSSFGKTTCRALGITYPNVTVVEEFTPIVTVTSLTTDLKTEYVTVRSTPVKTETVTTTLGQNGKRDAQITAMPRGVPDMQKSDYINMFRRQSGNSTDLPDNVIAASLSSACSCQNYIDTTVTQTYTNQPDTFTLRGFARSTSTIYNTRVEKEITSTVTIIKSPDAPVAMSSPSGDVPTPETNTTIAGDSGTESSVYVQTTGVPQGTPSIPEPSATNSTTPPTANPTAPPFTCPEDNGRTISQMLGSERFDYDVYCDADLPNSPEIPLDLSYDSFSQCVAACSLSNMQFPNGPPICQGVAYFETSGNNCILKSTANATDRVAATGVDIAVLKRIAVGIDGDHAEGTNTETVASGEATPTIYPSEVGSMLSIAMGNSTTSVPMIEPPAIITGRPAMDGVTAYSTYVSDGQTFSTGSVFSTYVSTNGSWWYSYYSTWSLAWEDVQTIYAAGETAISIVVNNTGVSEQHNGANGEYSIISVSNTTKISHQTNQTVYDTTELIGNNTYDANGTQIFETTTTNFYTYTEAAAGGGGGGGAGVVTSTSFSSFSTETVIYSSGFTGGQNAGQGSGGVVLQTPGPVLTSTSAFSTQSVISSVGGASGAESGQGSGAAGSDVSEGGVTSTLTSAFSSETVIAIPGNTAGGGGGFGNGGAGSGIPITTGSSVILVSGGTAYSTGYVASGVISINGTSGGTGAVGSGAIETSVITSTGGTAGFTAGQGSGGVGGTAGATSTGGAGFTNSPRPRLGTESDSTSFPATETAPAPYPPPTIVSSGTITSLNASLPVPTGTSSGSFSNTKNLRSGTESDSSTFDMGTGPVPYPPLSTAPSSGVVPSVNSSTPIPTGTGPVPYVPPIVQTLSFPTGTGPIPYPPLSTAPSASVPSSNASTSSNTISRTSGARSGTESTESMSITSRPPVIQTLPYGPFPTPSGSISLSTGGPSNSTFPPFPTGTAPPATSCPSMSVGTTTMWATTTVYGCYAQCTPDGKGGYGYGGGFPGGDNYQGPRSFGPPGPVFAPTLSGDPTPPPTSSAETSS